MLLGRMLRWAKAIAFGAAMIPASAGAGGEDARAWIATELGHSAEWRAYGTLEVPSGSIFIGDPSWGGDYHLRGTKAVAAGKLEVWLLIADSGEYVHGVWLEAAGGVPAGISGDVDFGMDSAYFALGDLRTGQDLANIGDLGLPKVPDSFEFFLPHIQNFGFTAVWLDVPPEGRKVLAVETKRDGGLKAVWVEDAGGAFSGVLIDITGRAGDGRFLDTVIGE